MKSKYILTAALLFAAAAYLQAARHAAPSKTRNAPASIPAAARRWMRTMTLRQEVAQLVVVPFYGERLNARSGEYRKYVRWVKETAVGGLILVNRVQNGTVRHAEPLAVAAFLNRMQKLAKVPLIVGGDFERASSMRVETNTRLPHNMALAATGDTAASRFAGELTAREARALGVHWVFAPVADVNNNPDNPIINIRSFGEDPQRVAEHVTAFIQGARADQAHPVLVTVKHFPGHGDTATDTHIGLATLPVDRERLDRVELVPFRAAIEAGVDSVMSAHIAATSLDPSGVPATLSQPVLTGLLRNELGFKGLVVTDALDMQGVAKQWSPAEVAVRAIQAGADILLMPPRPEEAIEGVVSAVASGKITRERIRESVARILAAKVRLGLATRRIVDLEQVSDELDSPEAIERVQDIADRSVTLVRNGKDMLPLSRENAPCFAVLAESRLSTSGRVFQEEVRKRAPKATVLMLDPGMPETEIDKAAAAASGCSSVVVAAYVTVAAYRGNVALAGAYPRLMDALLASGKPVALVSLGNPYLLRAYPAVGVYLATYSTVPPSEIAVVKALFGEIPIRGRLPVTIPGLADRGAGLQLPAAARPPA